MIEPKIYFPIKYSPHDYQIDAIDFIKKSIINKKRYILLNLPTGLGKSFISVSMFSNWYKNFVNNDVKIDILTNSKVLQEQYLKDFEFIRNFKGKNNYHCHKFNTDCSVGKELCKSLKINCDSCPYDNARNKWLLSDIGLTNFHLFNTLSIYQKGVLNSRNSNVLIIDESHDFESTFSDFLSTKVSSKTLKNCGFDIKEVTNLDNKYISKIKTLDKYMDFLNKKLIPILKSKLGLYSLKIESSNNKKRILYTGYVKKIETKLLSFEKLFESYEKNPENVVLDVIKNKDDKINSGIELITQHIWVYEFINDYVWKNYDHIIFMSASILDKKLFSFINGLDEEYTSYYEIPTPFKIKNRKIYYIKVGKMNYTNKEYSFEKMIPWIKKILNKYKDKKGIIHTTNYEITNWIKDNIFDDRLLFHDSKDRNVILDKHLSSSDPTVIVSPSMMSGIDLKDDLGRFQILIKIPYPNISSNKIKGRQKTNSDWYSLKTSMDLIQMYGRTTRSKDDYSDTFILDSNFSDILKYNKYLPKYFLDAIKTLNI